MIKFNEATKIINDIENKDVPKELTQQLLMYDKKYQQFGPDTLIKRITLIHLICILVSLGFCHQFGLGYFNQLNMFIVLKYLSLPIANFLAGAFLMSLSGFFSTFYLTPLERNLVLTKRPESLVGITILTAIGFVLFGENTWYNTIFWIFGGSIGAYYGFVKGSQYQEKKS